MRVHEAVEEIRKTIKRNLYDKAGKTGYLTQKEAEYLTCLVMKHEELEQLLRKDEVQWSKHISASKKKAKDVIQELERATTEHNQRLATILNNSTTLQIEMLQPKFRLRKLPLWKPEVTAEKINFEWPTEE